MFSLVDCLLLFPQLNIFPTHNMLIPFRFLQ